jgi:hypothetical protein
MRLRTLPRAIIAAPSLTSVLGRNGKADVDEQHLTAAAIYGDVVGPSCHKRSAHPGGRKATVRDSRPEVGLIAGDAQQSQLARARIRAHPCPGHNRDRRPSAAAPLLLAPNVRAPSYGLWWRRTQKSVALERDKKAGQIAFCDRDASATDRLTTTG